MTLHIKMSNLHEIIIAWPYLSYAKAIKAFCFKKGKLGYCPSSYRAKLWSGNTRKGSFESQAKLQNAQQQIASLESALSDKVADCSELSISLQEADLKSEEHLSQLAEQKAQYQSLYKELCLERQWANGPAPRRGIWSSRFLYWKLLPCHNPMNWKICLSRPRQPSIHFYSLKSKILHWKINYPNPWKISRQKCTTARIGLM